MDRQKTAAVILVLAVIGVGLGIFFANRGQSQSEPTPAPKATPRTAASAPATAAPAATQPAIRFTDSGFSPATLTVSVGDTVTIHNDSTASLNFASNPHPTHTDNPFLNLGVLEPGQTKTVKIPKAGTFKYHDHLDTSMTGTIVAQ